MRDPRWRKVLRDLWGNKTRTMLVVLAIAVGIFAFGSVFITQEVLLADLSAQYRSINASTITMGIPSFEDSLVRWVRHQEQAADAQGRAMRRVRLLRGNQAYNVDLYAFDDYEEMRVNRISIEKGTWPPRKRDIFFERASIPLTGAQIGDTVVIELPSGRQHELKVAGTVHDLRAIPASIWPEISGYVSLETMEWIGFPYTYNQLEIVAQGEFDSRAKLEKLADELKEKLEHKGFSVGSTSVREPGEHWAEDTTASFVAILGGVGIFSLVLSGFLVVNTITAMLSQQRRQVGMMKAIGGTGGQITGIYMVMVACFGLLALFVALPVGSWLAYLFTLAMAQFLNIDILHFHMPLQVFLLEVIAALLVPVVAALLPVLNGVRVTVREAISTYGIESRGEGGLIDRMLVRVRALPRPVLLSLRNTFRRKGRLFVTLGTLALAGTLFVSIANVRGAMEAELTKALKMYDFEVQLFLDNSYRSRMLEHRAEHMPGVILAEGRTSAEMQRVKPDGTEGVTFGVIGLPPDSNFVQPTLLSGRWLQEEDRNAIVLNSELIRDEPDIRVGDEIVLKLGNKEYDWEVVGIVLMTTRGLGYAPFDYLSHIKKAGGLASRLLVKTEQKGGQFQSAVARALEDGLKSAGIGVVYSMTIDDIIRSNASRMDFLINFLMSMAVMAAVIGGLGLAGTMTLNVLERTREIGVMRSIGASSGMVGSIVLTEGMLIGFISWLLAVPLSVPVSLVFGSVIGHAFFDRPLGFSFSLTGLTIWLAIVMIASVVASLLPAHRAMSMSVQETLAYE